LAFANVSYIVIDGIQFNDYRFPVGDKRNPAFIRGAMILGHWIASTPTTQGSNNPANRGRMVSNCVVKNCYFSNMSFGFTEVSAMNTIITNNVFTNFKSSPDTSGTYDVLGAAIEGLSGFNVEISRNYFRGAWAGSGRVSSSDGMGGTALDIFWSFKNSKVVYNTFVDCSGVFEVGNIDDIDSATGAQYDTFAFNKVINCGQLGYIHGTIDDDFYANNHNLYFWNNVVISNNKDRMNGQGFGDDTYGDTQSFSQFWFFRSKTKCPNNSLPISDPSWSNPINPVYCNYNGARSALQYASDQAVWGMGYDTLVDTRNNIFYSTSGGYMIYDVTRTRYKHKNNIYYIKGGFAGNNTALGGTLGTGEIQTTSKLFVDTTNAFPENWDLHLAAGSQAIGAGTTISGVTKDFAGIPLSGTPDIGLYKYSAKPLLAVSSTGITCKTRTDGTITVTVSGGTSPYTYRINNGTWQSSSSFTALPSGTYTVAVKDTNGALGTTTSSVKGSNVVVCP
jgi:hypothetical protein